MTLNAEEGRADYRLRQVAFASADLESVADDFEAVFGLKIAFRDPEIIHYGLKNIVLPAGPDFVEVVQPVQPNTSAGRYLARRGGDGGYMVIMQTGDALAHRERLRASGIEIVDVMDVEDHQCSHIHPREFGGILASIDSTPVAPNWRDAESHWYPAGGANWPAARTADVEGIAAVAIQSADPADTAMRWSRILAAPLQTPPPRIPVLRGAEIRFVAPVDRHARGIAYTELAMKEPGLAIERARSRGLGVEDGAVMICGARFRPVASDGELA
jgi:hypothetical protein